MLERYPAKWDQFDGGKSVFRAGAACSAMPAHRASAATNPGSRFAPPQAGCFLTVASLRSFADAPHRHAKRASPPPKIIPVKWFHLVGQCSNPAPGSRQRRHPLTGLGRLGRAGSTGWAGWAGAGDPARGNRGEVLRALIDRPKGEPADPFGGAPLQGAKRVALAA